LAEISLAKLIIRSSYHDDAFVSSLVIVGDCILLAMTEIILSILHGANQHVFVNRNEVGFPVAECVDALSGCIVSLHCLVAKGHCSQLINLLDESSVEGFRLASQSCSSDRPIAEPCVHLRNSVCVGDIIDRTTHKHKQYDNDGAEQ